MRIGNLGCRYHLFAGGILYTECDVVVEGVIEQDGLLVHVTHYAAQRPERDIADIGSIN